MSLFEMIGAVLIGPLKLLFEVIFSVAYESIQHPGPAIIVLSLMMNILVLPLYRRADAIQIESRDTENRLKPVVDHIKKTFSGDERMMILQTYYRQNNYSPLSVLSGSISLMLEIPFFMAAYQFLSGVEAFQGVSFGPIADLSVPDGMLMIGGLSINLLPIIMTLVNVVSSSLYLKGFPLKTKIQLYGMALFFLVFLYNSPAALVFYWTLNNTFSLVKTLFYKLKNSRLVLNIMLCVLGVAAIVYGALMSHSALMICIGVAAQLPWILSALKKLPSRKGERKPAQPNKALFVCGALFLTILIGLLIPSTYVSASPQEYIDIYHFYNPVWYVINTLCLAAGTFMVWLGVFYWLANPKGKVIFTRIVWILSGVMLVNYMFFGTKLGVVSPDLSYANGFSFELAEQLINIAVVLALGVVMYFVAKKWSRQLTAILLVGAIALGGMSTINLVQIGNVAAETKAQSEQSGDQLPEFSLSTDGKNVVVIMLDRGIGPFVPFLMEERPELVEQFDGFTYYPNTISYGGFTNLAAPSLYGGYEYTPVEMNKRDTDLVADKHNEALKVMPTIFSEKGYDVTLIDPSFAGYQWIPDVSVFNDMPGVSAYLADGRFNDLETRINTINSRKRNFFFFSLMKAVPVTAQTAVYDDGKYHAVSTDNAANDTSGVAPLFINALNVLKNMSNITTVTQDSGKNFMFLRSNATHEPVVLQEPDYIPSSNVDNSSYYPEEGKSIAAGEKQYLLSSEYQISHYHVNMSALMQLGDWFDYLRKIGVYDNTRIIIVSDHGRDLGVFDEPGIEMYDIEFYLPMLLVKDFDAEGFTTSDEFMTNADVPSLAMEGLIKSPVNPFTGKEINTDSKKEQERQYITLSNTWEIEKNNGYQFLPAEWASVSVDGDVLDKNNWTFYNEESIFPPELSE